MRGVTLTPVIYRAGRVPSATRDTVPSPASAPWGQESSQSRHGLPELTGVDGLWEQIVQSKAESQQIAVWRLLY